MSYMEDAIQRQYEAWAEQEREWYDMCNEMVGHEGWTLVTLKDPVNWEMHEWLREKCYGKYEHFHNEVIFQDAKNANWFALRWI